MTIKINGTTYRIEPVSGFKHVVYHLVSSRGREYPVIRNTVHPELLFVIIHDCTTWMTEKNGTLQIVPVA